MSIKHFKSKLSKFYLTFYVIFLSLGCSKDTNMYVPDVFVYYELSLSSELANLGVNGFVTITPYANDNTYSIVDYHNGKLTYISQWRTYGNGVIIYRKNVSEYQAFDITCTYKGLVDHCTLSLKPGDFSATCPCCSSSFLLSANGYPTTKSVATLPLFQYKCVLDGTGQWLVVSK
jgi:hypothetical protein